jgi:hypothetical protein
MVSDAFPVIYNRRLQVVRHHDGIEGRDWKVSSFSRWS